MTYFPIAWNVPRDNFFNRKIAKNCSWENTVNIIQLIKGYYSICVGVSLNNVLLTSEAFMFLSRSIRTSYCRKSMGIFVTSHSISVLLLKCGRHCSLNLGAGAGTYVRWWSVSSLSTLLRDIFGYFPVSVFASIVRKINILGRPTEYKEFHLSMSIKSLKRFARAHR